MALIGCGGLFIADGASVIVYPSREIYSFFPRKKHLSDLSQGVFKSRV